MSQIDQAFIRAYGEPERESAPRFPAATTQPSAELPSTSNPAPAPHILTHPSLQGEQGPPVSSNIPEPIPAPHFQIDAFGTFSTSYDTSAPALAPVPLPPTPVPFVSQPSPEAVTAPPTPPAEPASQRRPLSSFSAPEPTATVAFHPVFEVDAFRWPETVDMMLRSHQDLLLPVLNQLLEAREAGRTMIGVAGTGPRVGCTTVYMCLARLLAQAGLEVALVDANFERGSLATELGLEFETGWRDVLLGKNPLAESVIRSLEDRLALLPLAGPLAGAHELLSSIQTSVTAGVLRYHYDAVLFDLGAPGQGPQRDAVVQILKNCRLDASLIVADSSSRSIQSADDIEAVMDLLGETCHGLIGNQAV